MNSPRILVFALLLSAMGARAADVADTKATADAAWQAYLSLPKNYPSQHPTPEETRASWKDWYRQVAPAGLKFYEDYPDDPRRWTAVDYYIGIMLNWRDSNADDKARALDLAGRMLTAKDADPKLQMHSGFTALRYRLDQDLNPSAAKEDLSPVAKDLAAYGARFPQAPNLFFSDGLYADDLAARDPKAADAYLNALLASPNAKVVEMAQGKLRTIGARSRPFELAFTAVDGREVDLAKMRGKVVLIDFWATWCGPCKEELPNVKAVFDKYQDKGFEVVGISLDGANARQKLIDYCNEHGISWPQYFDGKDWSNEVARKYAISSIPATFLLNRDGKIASTDARGDKLEPEVRAQLGL